MNKSIKESQKIVDQLIKKSFPELRDKNIKVFEIPKWIVWWVGGFVFKRFVIITKNVTNLDKESLKGLFAHELCHVEDSIKRTYIQETIQAIRESLSWLFNTLYSKNIERKTDLRTIKKGYAKELFKYSSEREKRKPKKTLIALYNRGYLSPKQIKSYAKKIGKW